MTIEVTEKGSKEFYKEFVNILTQYRQLLYKPQDKLRNNYSKNIFLTVAMVALFGLSLYGGINDSFNVMKILVMVLSTVAVVFTIMYLLRMNKAVNEYMNDDRPSVVTLDDNGVEIEKSGSQAIRLAWDNVAFVRVFNESTCFFSKDLNGIVLAVNNKYKNELLDYIKDNNIQVLVVR